MTTPSPLSGRRAEAARNDRRILEAARAVFLADPDAPIAAVATAAGVGISALYRRYHGKEDLLVRLSLDGVRAYIAAAEAALADEGDPWAAFAGFMCEALEAGATALTLRFAGEFTPSAELRAEGRRGYELTQRILDRAKAAGVLRPEIESGDVALLLEQLQSVRVADEARTEELRRRYLTVLLDGLRAPAPAPLPGPAPTWGEIGGRYGRAGDDPAPTPAERN